MPTITVLYSFIYTYIKMTHLKNILPRIAVYKHIMCSVYYIKYKQLFYFYLANYNRTDYIKNVC